MNDWDAYRILLAVAEQRSFSAAAKALGISQPTAGRRIDALERELGVRLLVRQNRGVTPTAAGEEALVLARRMAEGADAIRRQLKAAAARTVRLSVTEGLAARFLPQHLAADELAGIRLELVVDNASSNLAAREADVAIRLFEPTQPDLVTRKVAKLAFGLVAAPSYLAAHGKPRRASDLAKHRHIGIPPHLAAVPAHFRWYRQLVSPEAFVLTTTNLVTMLELARAGLGITLTAAAYYADDPGLVRVLPLLKPPELDVWLTIHGDLRRDSAVTRVVDWLTRTFRREAAVLAGHHMR